MMFPIQFLTIIAVLCPTFTAQAICRDQPRSVAEMATAATSVHQAQLDNRLSWALKPVACFSGEKEFVASVQGRRFLAPCRFITETTQHVNEIVASEGSKQTFALDVDHAHLAVTAEIWDEKYRELLPEEILPVVLRDTSLVAIYHSACHCPIADRKSAGTTALELNEKRHFLGFYDGRAMANLPYRKPGSEQTHGQYYRPFAWFSIAAHKSGELVLSAKGKSVAIDIFFDDDHAAAPVPDIVNVSTSAK